MSYARWNEGDCYIYHDVKGYLICMICLLMPLKDTFWGWPPEKHIPIKLPKDFTCTKRSEMIAHVKEHGDKGHNVDVNDICQRLTEEIEELGDEIPPSIYKNDSSRN